MFITVEGIDGSGKSTHAAYMVELLREAGKKVLWTREPGGWGQGETLRSLILNGRLENPVTEVLLFLADRCEHTKQVIEPALSAGDYVVCERYNDSTRAYQCWGRNLDRRKLEKLIEWCSLPDPDLTIWLDLSVDTAQLRRMSRGNADRIENEKRLFHVRVAQGFRELADEYSKRFVRVVAEGTKLQTEQQILKVFQERGML
jgi:dTMP kinase